MYNNLPRRTGIYHITDNIGCLELEVHFRHVNSLLNLPKFNYTKRTSGTNSEKRSQHATLQHTNEENASVRSIRIKWQQKLLSPSEVQLYKEARNCYTDTQKKYHQWLQAEGIAGSNAELDTDTRSSKSSAKRRKNGKKPRKLASSTQCGSEIFTYVHEDNFDPTADSTITHKAASHAGDNKEAVVLMYIYAAITPDTQLVVLRWYAQQRQLHIYPDFNDFALQPYYIEIDTDYRHLYAYAVRNVSLRRRCVPNVNFLQLPEWPTHWRTERELSAQFAMPPKRTKRVVLLVEIHSAEQFIYDSLHVRYHVQLPPNTLLEEGMLHASTHASSANAGVAGVRHFGYNWQLTLLCEEDFNVAHLLHIYFELISIDGWERERAEGYAHYSTYLLPGCDVVQLQCLRPAEGVLDALSRYFIGGRRKFDFVHYFTPPATETALQNRYGCRMQSTGQLHISCQRLVQRNCELLQPCASRTSGMTLDDIMLAYREARKRLEAVALK